MKSFLRSCLLPAMTLALAGSPAHAADTPPALAKKNGYTVMVEVKVNEQGEKENARLLETEDKSVGDVLTKMAVAMALKTDLPVRQKDGKPIRYTARMPFFFPVEDDEGPDAEQLPKPKVVYGSATLPAYPAALREEGVVGGAVLELNIDAQGNLTHVSTLRASHPEFEAAARDAVNSWKYVAAQRDGQPAASRTRLAIAFETQETMANLRWRLAPRPSLGSFLVIRPDEPIDDAEMPADATAPADVPATTPAQ